MNFYGTPSTKGVPKNVSPPPPPLISSLLRSELQEVREAAVARSAAREHVSMRQITHALFV